MSRIDLCSLLSTKGIPDVDLSVVRTARQQTETEFLKYLKRRATGEIVEQLTFRARSTPGSLRILGGPENIWFVYIFNLHGE